MPPAPRKPRGPVLWFSAYVVACALALTWPVFPWLAQRVELTVLGLPFPFAWNVGWVLATFVVLVVFDRAMHPED